MKKILLSILILIALVMIYLGVSASMIPPTLTGIGFVIIAIILFQKKN